MKRYDLAVLQVKDITAGCVYLLVRWWDDNRRKGQISLVSSIQRQLHDDNIVVEIKAVKLSMHVGKGGGINVNCFSYLLAPIFLSGADIIKIPILRKERKRI